MSKQSTSNVFGMPFRKNPRNGQSEVFNKIIEDQERKSLNVQLPTGYGKSFVSAGVYSILKKQNRANRLLIIVPTTAQFDQYVKDGPADLLDAAVDGDRCVTDISYLGVGALRHHRNGTRQIYITTIQFLNSSGRSTIIDMMQTGQWMVTVDEYHHYGIDKSWGKSVTNLPYSFLLAMSATPYRPDDDSAFGIPDVVVSYRTAAIDSYLKTLKAHSYIYNIDAVLPGGEIVTMTTDDLVRDAGTCAPEAIEKHRIQKRMRWSPKYISPLVTHPIERMISERIRTGYKLQVIVGAMCVSHASMVCEQISTIYPELVVDWVGTGINGRPPEKNSEILGKFCPQKDDDGNRSPTIDILVHVGMAGEGLDSIYVSEVVHLNKAAINNSNNQENGRAARYLPGVVGNINFDSSSEYAVRGYIGKTIMDAMDNLPPVPDDEDEKEFDQKDNEYSPLPELPAVGILNMALKSIDSGSPEVMRMISILATDIAPNVYGIHGLESDINNPDSQLHSWALNLYRTMRARESEAYDEKSTIVQWKEQVNNAVTHVTGLVIKKMKSHGNIRLDKSISGDVKRRINTRKMRAIGNVQNDVQTMKTHYRWIKDLEGVLMRNAEIPSWLL